MATKKKKARVIDLKSRRPLLKVQLIDKKLRNVVTFTFKGKKYEVVDEGETPEGKSLVYADADSREEAMAVSAAYIAAKKRKSKP